MGHTITTHGSKNIIFFLLIAHVSTSELARDDRRINGLGLLSIPDNLRNLFIGRLPCNVWAE